jgi:hypothetical protein
MNPVIIIASEIAIKGESFLMIIVYITLLRH